MYALVYPIPYLRMPFGPSIEIQYVQGPSRNLPAGELVPADLLSGVGPAGLRSIWFGIGSRLFSSPHRSSTPSLETTTKIDLEGFVTSLGVEMDTCNPTL